MLRETTAGWREKRGNEPQMAEKWVVLEIARDIAAFARGYRARYYVSRVLVVRWNAYMPFGKLEDLSLFSLQIARPARAPSTSTSCSIFFPVFEECARSQFDSRGDGNQSGRGRLCAIEID